MRFKKRLSCLCLSILLSACQTTDPDQVKKSNQFDVIADTKVYNFKAMPHRTAQPDITVKSNQNVSSTAICIQEQLKKQFKLPDNFFEKKSYASRGETVALVNPFTNVEGLVFEITPSGINDSIINLYSNGTRLSKAWKNIPNKCKSQI